MLTMHRQPSHSPASPSRIKMQTSADDVANSIKKITLNDYLTRSHEKEPCRSIPNDVVFLTKAIQEIIRHAKPATSQALSVESLIGDESFSAISSIADICLLHEQSKELANITSILEKTILLLNEVNELSIIVQLESLRYRNSGVILKQPLIEKLILHFETKIREIIREVFKTASDQDLLWRVAEECYNQTTRSGSLQIGAFRKQEDCRPEDYLREKQIWADFWISVLKNAPNGPTLFYPRTDLDTALLSMEVPRYLFRTYDAGSSGKNDTSVIASIADSRINILQLEEQRAAKLLGNHLDKGLYSGKFDDNLMSWTSSLLFTIQYAIYRTRWRSSSDIKICVVDTRKYPTGQFIRDLSLLERYRTTAETLGGETLRIFKLRLKEEYHNGEYLSQGAVNLSNRSCVVTFEKLEQAGLYRLYPEFKDPKGKNQWAERVRDLRQQDWAAEQQTTDEEIKIALKIAWNCFEKFEPLDLASILLTFKNRRFSRPNRTPDTDDSNEESPPWADKPEEVRRSWIAAEAIESSVADLSGLTGDLSRRQEILRGVFS